MLPHSTAAVGPVQVMVGAGAVMDSVSLQVAELPALSVAEQMTTRPLLAESVVMDRLPSALTVQPTQPVGQVQLTFGADEHESVAYQHDQPTTKDNNTYRSRNRDGRIAAHGRLCRDGALNVGGRAIDDGERAAACGGLAVRGGCFVGDRDAVVGFHGQQ